MQASQFATGKRAGEIFECGFDFAPLELRLFAEVGFRPAQIC